MSCQCGCGRLIHRDIEVFGMPRIRDMLISPLVCNCAPDDMETDGEGTCLNCGLPTKIREPRDL